MIGPNILAPSGVMPTICDVPDGALTCYRAGDDLSLEHVGRDGTITALAAFAVVAPGGGDSTFAKLRSWQERQWLGYRSGFGNVAALREVTGGFLGPEIRFGAVVGNCPVAFSDDGWFGWQRADGAGVDGVHLDALGEAPVRLSTRYAPTGLASIASGGAPVFVDDNRGSVPGMYDPSRAGLAIVGKGLDGGLAVKLDGKTAVLLPGQFTNDPAAADLGGGLYAAVYWMPQGNALGPVACLLFTADDVQPAPIVIPPINRPCLFGWFTYGVSGEEPGNCVLTVDAKMHVVDRASGEVLATFVEGSPDGDVAAVERAIAAAHAAEPSLPIIAYWTAAAQADRIPLGAEVIGVELYPRAGEGLEAAEQRVRASVAVCPAAILVVQAFTSNTSLTTDLAGVLAMAARIAAGSRNVLGLLLFSAGTRATGYTDHPEMHAAYAAVFGSILGPAVLPRPHAAPPMPVPSPAPRPVPQPRPVPRPTPVPSTLFPAARPLGGSMQAYLKIGPYYTGVNPTAQTKDAHGHPLTGDAQYTPYFNRPGEPNAAGGWEAVELTPLNALQFAARYVEANRQCSIGDDGSLQSRAGGAVGPWETFYCTTQPDGSNLLYRFTSSGALVACVLTIEEAQ